MEEITNKMEEITNKLVEAQKEIIASKNKTIEILLDENKELKGNIEQLNNDLKIGSSNFSVILEKVSDIGYSHRKILEEKETITKENIEIKKQINFLYKHEDMPDKVKEDYLNAFEKLH